MKPRSTNAPAWGKHLCLRSHQHPPCMATNLAALPEPAYAPRVKSLRYHIQFITKPAPDLNGQDKERKILGRNNQNLQLLTKPRRVISLGITQH